MKHNLEIYADCILEAIGNIDPKPDIPKIIAEFHVGEESYLYNISLAIVEPTGIPDEYESFVEDSCNWVNFIRQIAGDQWYDVAMIITEFGY